MTTRRLFVALLLFSCPPVLADRIAIIGTGNVAKALGPEFAAQGNTIIYGSRAPDGLKAQDLVKVSGDDAKAVSQPAAIIGADIVVLAVPGMLVEEIVMSLGDLSGKIIIDPTNPLVPGNDGEMQYGVETSNGEIIQAAAPSAFVVKAFNTLYWQTMVDPDTSGGPTSVPIAGNDKAAKERVAELVTGMGLHAIDVGMIEDAHWVEGMLMLWIKNRIGDRPTFDFYLRETSNE
jgi:predicted dinucleotide-binding enzyme